MSNLSLYHMTSEMLALLDSEEEITQEQLDAAFANIVKKDAALCHFLKDVEASVVAFKAEEKRIADRRKALENAIGRVKEYAKLCMERLGMDRLEAGTFKLSIQANPPALEITDEEAIPNEYKIVIPATVAPDKERIKSDLKAGKDIPGAKLTVGKSLRIR